MGHVFCKYSVLVAYDYGGITNARLAFILTDDSWVCNLEHSKPLQDADLQ